MICLTGDVHHASLMTNDQKHIPDPALTEIRVTQEYLRILERHDVKSTLYVCGRCFTEEWDDLAPVAGHPLVEIGGHMFNARFPRECFDAYGERTGLWNGPRWYQDWDIRRNVEVARVRGIDLLSWRAHSYMVDPNTYELLAAHGIRLVSDRIDRDAVRPKRIEHDLVSHPMNTIPDHDHLYHAHRTREVVEEINRRGYGADAFGAVSYEVGEWGNLVIDQALAVDEAGGVATILAHPLCMYLADGFATLDRLLAALTGRITIHARDILSLGEEVIE